MIKTQLPSQKKEFQNLAERNRIHTNVLAAVDTIPNLSFLFIFLSFSFFLSNYISRHAPPTACIYFKSWNGSSLVAAPIKTTH